MLTQLSAPWRKKTIVLMVCASHQSLGDHSSASSAGPYWKLPSSAGHLRSGVWPRLTPNSQGSAHQIGPSNPWTGCKWPPQPLSHFVAGAPAHTSIYQHSPSILLRSSLLQLHNLHQFTNIYHKFAKRQRNSDPCAVSWRRLRPCWTGAAVAIP